LRAPIGGAPSTEASMTAFDQAFAAVVGEEGGFTANAADPGNWTGGAVGKGVCRGTKFGISAAAYPTLDIAALTVDQARAVYKRDYWDKVAGDALPPALALLVFDAAVNNGVARGARWLQAAVGVEQDGDIGPQTLAAIAKTNASSSTALLAEVLAQRMNFMAGLPTWRTFGLGWSRRLCALPFKALQMTAALEQLAPAPST
jgi:lysozyme family protein